MKFKITIITDIVGVEEEEISHYKWLLQRGFAESSGDVDAIVNVELYDEEEKE